MGIAEIKAMRETLQKMETMKEEVTKDINRDINQKRKAALAKIREYLSDMAIALDGIAVSVDLENGALFSSYYHGQRICFWQKYPMSRSHTNSKWSEDNKNWFITCYDGCKQDDSNYWCYIDETNSIERSGNPGKWSEGFIDLIENWEKIKPIIEESVQKALSKRMEIVRDETQAKLTSYEKVTDFEA